MLKDCMTAIGFWTDDVQVTMETVLKMDVGDPEDAGIYIKLEEMDDSEV
jgi:Holliday junction resolvase RusA-like endonuclease